MRGKKESAAGEKQHNLHSFIKSLEYINPRTTVSYS